MWSMPVSCTKSCLFYFLCGKLGHRESFCPVRVRIDSSNIILGWDASLRVPTRRKIVGLSRWLRDFDGSTITNTKMESGQF